MALPKKGSRSIVVEDIKYRWMGDAANFEGDNFGLLFIEHYDNPRQKIKATFSWTRLNNAYKKVGHQLAKAYDNPPPYIVRQTILYGLKNGWKPNAGGGVLDLGNLDSQLNYEDMNEQE
ncbi:MAG TPA: hypothetical protein DCS93_40795 [Microscillaceae bacterium]|nr:hypothetical protein [Microscillaceae bacterium]